MTWADYWILAGTVCYLGAATSYVFDSKPYAAAIFFLYGVCNVLIAMSAGKG